MDKKAKIKEYKDTPLPMGIYQIINKVNGKMLIGSSVNLPAILNRCQAELKMGSHRNQVLQKEWKQFGPENFEFKELEIFKPATDPNYDSVEELHVLEELWLEKLSPFGDKGYNKPPLSAASK
jgi:group I intron endonuclease